MSIEYGDELVTIVQIDQPFCNREYGDAELNSPSAGCTAGLGVTGTRKCYNTRATCQDSSNYDPGTLTLSFSRSQEGLEYLGYVIPSLEALTITPMRINIGAMDRDVSPFGQREVVTAQFSDHQHSDHKVDSYRLERHDGSADDDGAYDPYARGTFWRKWLARNPYHEGYAFRVYQGKVGQALAEMEVRHYIVDKINGPNDGKVSIVAKDLFAKVESRKAMAPVASLGELAANISAVAGSATLSPTGIGDLEYPASGYIAINKEEIAFTRSSDTLTLTTRGANGTTAAAHEAEDKVQLVLVYSAQEAQDIVSNLLTEYTDLTASNIPTTDWDAEAAANFPNLYSAHIVEPTPVSQLIGELAEQVGFSIWPDVSTNLIELKALVPASAGSIEHTVDDDAWIKAGSLAIRRLPDQRVSEVWVYYGLKNPLDDLDRSSNYRSRVVSADLPSEGPQQYGTPSVREVYSRWIPQFGRSSATDVGERILSIFRDPPFRASFDLYAARDGSLALAEPFQLSTDEITDDTGSTKLTTHLPVKLSREDDVVRVESQQLQFYIDAAADSPADSERVLYIDNDTNDFNIRTEHDALFQVPVSGDVVRVIISSGVVVGASSTSATALQTGSFPAGVEIIVQNLGRIAGHGGNGGAPGITGLFEDGFPGLAGGLALSVAVPVKIYNVVGTIAGGGGGGGGGSAGASSGEGGGGGGGAGRNVGTGYTFLGAPASDGTLLAGGAGGDTTTGGDGGAGGGPGQAGSSGTSVGGHSGGAGGAAGAAISGVSNITWVDANDNTTVDDGTILGATS